MSAVRLAGRTLIRCLIAWPFAVLAGVAGFLLADELTRRRYIRNGNAPLIDLDAEFARMDFGEVEE